MTHRAVAFTTAHPGVTSALIGVGTLNQACQALPLANPDLRRRPMTERAAA